MCVRASSKFQLTMLAFLGTMVSVVSLTPAFLPTRALVARAPMPTMGPFGSKTTPSSNVPKTASEKNAALNEVMKKDQKSWTPEDKKLITQIASNWGDTKKPEQEGYVVSAT